MPELAPALSPGIEAVAVALAIAYLLLAIRQSLWCWPAAIGSSLIYLWLMYRAGLYMESALQLFYAGVAVYGWWLWQRGGAEEGPLRVSTWPRRRHAGAIAGILALSLASGTLLERYSDAQLPYLDSFTTWGAIVATWMVARKLLENWVYWFVIDAVAMYLYLSRGLYLTTALFALYLVLVVVGFIAWRRSFVHDGELRPA